MNLSFLAIATIISWHSITATASSPILFQFTLDCTTSCNPALCSCISSYHSPITCASELHEVCVDGSIDQCIPSHKADRFISSHCPYTACLIEGRPEEECNCEFYEKACEIYSDENRGYCAIAECCTSGDVDKTDCLRVDAASTKTRHAQSLVATDTDAWFTISQITQAAFDLGDTIMSMDQLGDAEDFILDDFLLTDDSTNFTWTDPTFSPEQTQAENGGTEQANTLPTTTPSSSPKATETQAFSMPLEEDFGFEMIEESLSLPQDFQAFSMPLEEDFGFEMIEESLSLPQDFSFSITENETEEKGTPTTKPISASLSNQPTVNTASTSMTPTSEPTENPSNSPLSNLDDSPTSEPSFSPTFSPSFSPTMTPTFEAEESTMHPSSVSPITRGPSQNPTNHPTLKPTKTPSIAPITANPALSPVESPQIEVGTLIQLHMETVTKSMNDYEVYGVFQPSCEDFLTQQLLDEEPQVFRVKCTVTNQQPLSQRMLSSVGLRHLQISSLLVNVEVTGVVISSETVTSAEDVDFDNMVYDAFAENDEVFLNALKNKGDIAGIDTFDDLTSIVSVTQTYNKDAISEGSGSGITWNKTGALAAMAIGGVALVLLMIALAFQIKIRFADDGSVDDSDDDESDHMGLKLPPEHIVLSQDSAQRNDSNLSYAFSLNSGIDSPISFLSESKPTWEDAPQMRIRRDIMAPPGKIGIIIDTSNKGPIVHSVKDNSVLEGLVFEGDVILALDDEDTTAWSAHDLTKLVASRSRCERKITVLSTVQ